MRLPRPTPLRPRRWLIPLTASVLLVGPFAGVAAADDEPDDDEAVRSIVATLTVADDGSVQVREEISYDFGADGNHGLLRSIPVRAPWGQTRDRRYPVEDLRVSSPTGAATQVEQATDGGVLELRIGDPDRDDVTGVQTYVLDYRMLAVVDDRGAAGQTLDLDAVGTGWQVPIDEVGVTVTAPVDLLDARCVTGGDGSTTPCPVAETTGPSARFAAGGLAPEEGVTVGVTLPAGTLNPAPPILQDTFSPARAFTAAPAQLGAGAGVLALGALGIVVARRRHGPRDDDAQPGGATPAGVLRYRATPPDDAPPGVLGALVHRGAQDSDVVGTLLDLARRGHVEIEPLDAEGGDFLLRRRPSSDATRAAERRLLQTLFPDNRSETTLSALRTTAGCGTAEVKKLLETEVVSRGWFSTRPADFATRWFLRSLGVLALGIVATVLLAWLTTWGLVGVALVVVGVGAMFGAIGISPLTPKGHAATADALAFRDSLAVYDQVPRGDGERLTRYLPHAVALGATEQWNQGVQALQRVSPVPVPGWFGAPDGAHTTNPSLSTMNMAVFGAMLGTFSSRSSDALTAPDPSAASSSSGTSTYTGGGAGGGGGGSW